MADPVQVAGHVYKPVFENKRVRVLEVRMKAGDKTPMHSHPDVVAITVRGGKVKFTAPDGQTVEADLADGSVMFFDAAEHITEHLGTSDAHLFLVELK